MKNTNSNNFRFISLFVVLVIVITSTSLISISVKKASDDLLDIISTEEEDITSSSQDNEISGSESDTVIDNVLPVFFPGDYVYVDGSTGEFLLPLKVGIRKFSDGTYGFSLYSDEVKKNTYYYLDLELWDTYYAYGFYFPTYEYKGNIFPCIMCYDSLTSPGEAWTETTENKLLDLNTFVCYPNNSNYYEVLIFKADCSSDEEALNLLPYFVYLIKDYSFGAVE